MSCSIDGFLCALASMRLGGSWEGVCSQTHAGAPCLNLARLIGVISAFGHRDAGSKRGEFLLAFRSDSIEKHRWG